MKQPWNLCDECGQLIPIMDFGFRGATRRLVFPDSDRSVETWETVCRDCNEPGDKR